MSTSAISKEEAIAAFGGNAAALARALGITPSAVYQWPDGPIAEVHSLKLRYVLKPDVFGTGEAPPARRTGAEGKDAGERPKTVGTPAGLDAAAVVSEAA